MRGEHLAEINAARRARRAVILVTDIETGAGQVIAEGAEIDAALRVVAEEVFRTGKSGLVELDGKRLFFNVQVPPPRIAVIGAAHISQALAAI